MIQSLLQSLIEDYKIKTKQIVNAIFLTDGASSVTYRNTSEDGYDVIDSQIVTMIATR